MAGAAGRAERPPFDILRVDSNGATSLLPIRIGRISSNRCAIADSVAREIIKRRGSVTRTAEFPSARVDKSRRRFRHLCVPFGFTSAIHGSRLPKCISNRVSASRSIHQNDRGRSIRHCRYSFAHETHFDGVKRHGKRGARDRTRSNKLRLRNCRKVARLIT